MDETDPTTAPNIPVDAAKGLRIRDFFAIEADTLLERYKVIETLLPHHKTRGAAH